MPTNCKFAWMNKFCVQEWEFLCRFRLDYRRLGRIITGERAPFRNWLVRKKECFLSEYFALQNSGRDIQFLAFQINAIDKYLISSFRRNCTPMSPLFFKEYFQKLTVQQLNIMLPEPTIINCMLNLEMVDTFWHEDVEFYVYVPESVMKECGVAKYRGSFRMPITPFFVFRRYENSLLYVMESYLNAKAHDIVMEKLCK